MMDSIEDAYPLNAVHSGILFHSLQGIGADVYSSVLSLRVIGNLDKHLFKRAWQHVFAHHSSLRSSVVVDGLDEPLWVVHKTIEPIWDFHDFSTLTNNLRASSVQNVHDELVDFRFSFSSEALMRFTLIKVSDHNHQLFWNIHHLISDGWSTSVILEDLASAYAACKQGNSVTLPAALPYREFLIWQASINQADQLTYWSNYLSNRRSTPIKKLNLTVKKTQSPAPPVHTCVSLEANRSDSIKRTAQNFETTESVLFFAAWALVLRDLSQNQAPLFGATVAGRPSQLAAIERSVGLFAATLPLYVDTSIESSLRDWLKALGKTLQNHATHDAVPLVELQKLVERDHNEPIFNSVVAIQGHTGELQFGSAENDNIKIDSIEYTIRSHFDISLLITIGNQTQLKLITQTHAFDESTNRAILKRYESALDLLTNGSCDSLASLRERWIKHSHKTYPLATSITPSIFSRIDRWIQSIAHKQPDATAVIQGNTSLSYSELERRAVRVSRAVNTISCDIHRPIAICLPNSIDAIVTIFGVLLADRYYLPLDPDQPQARRDHICEDANCELIVATQAVADSTAKPDSDHPKPRVVTVASLIEIRDLNTISIAKATNNVQNDSRPAYMMYTSGSTGTPKGVVISHANLLYSTQARFDYYPNKVSRFLLVSPLNFDSSVVGLYWTLCSGGALIIPEHTKRRDITHWCDLLKTQQISHLLCLPRVYRLLLEQSQNTDLQSLQTVIVAGETCDADLCSIHYKNHSDIALYNEYGPTEACVWSSVYLCKENETPPVPIGHAIPGTTIRVIGIDGACCPDGIEGELHVYGLGVTTGYHKRPELTKRHFLSDPAGYKTGDLGYRSRDGLIFCTGRVDRQIKVRGQRIEPEEIETAARHVDHILAARAFAVHGNNNTPDRLWLAYSPARIDVSQLKSIIERQLPSVMWPHDYLGLDSIPTLSNGKVSDQSLVEKARERHSDNATPKEDISTDKSVDTSSAAQPGQSENTDLLNRHEQTQTVAIKSGINSDIEVEIIRTVAVVLGKRISANDNFIQSGLDSMDAMRLTARLRTQFAVDLNLATVLESSDCRELAEHIHVLVTSATEIEAIAPEDTEINTVEIPATTGQSQLWYLEQVGLEPEVYAVQSTLRFQGSLSKEAIKFALNALVHRHEILRTRLRINNSGELHQVVYPPEPVNLNVVDQLNDNVTWRQARTAQLQQEFDLSEEQLFQSLLYRNSENDHHLMFHSHHIVLDGWSFELLHQQFAEYYSLYLDTILDAKIDDSPTITQALLPEPDQYQYKAFAHWQFNRENSAKQHEFDHWCKVLALPHEPISLPIDFPRSNNITYRGDSIIRAIDDITVGCWKKIAHDSKSTLFVVTLAAVKTCLRDLTGSKDLLIGTSLSNREESHWQKTLGFFSNTVVIRTTGTFDDCFSDSVKSTRTAVMRAMHNQNVPINEIVSALKLPRTHNKHPLFEVFFVFQQNQSPLPSIPNNTVEIFDEPGLNAAKFDLSIEIRPSDGQLNNEYVLHLNYNRDLFEAKTIEQLSSDMLSLMRASAQHPQTQINKLERLRLSPNHSTGQFALDDTYSHPQNTNKLNLRLDEVFQKTCLSRPNSNALSHNKSNVNYEALGQCVTRFSNALYGSDVQPGDIVAVSLPRSIHQIAAVLAISRCKAVWCPIDPLYPESRKNLMLEHSTARIVLLEQSDSIDTSKGNVGTIVINSAQAIETLEPQACTTTMSPVDAGESQWRAESEAAVLIYTSGSTGTPKGVLLSHKALMNRFDWMWTQYPFSPNDVNIIKTSCSFVDSLWESFGALLAGTQSVLVDDSDVTDIERFVNILRDNKISRLLLVPSLLSAILENMLSNSSTLPHLKLCSCSGELLPSKLASTFMSQIPHSRLLNLYGSTEVTADVTCHEITLSDTKNEVPLGVAITGTELFILDKQHQVMPSETSGEIAIKGLGLALGYHRDVETTSNKFLSFEGIGRVFLTGDTGQLDKQGLLRFEGRKDLQIKVRGIRINCHEIELQLGLIPGISNAIVFAQGNLDERVLCATIQPDIEQFENIDDHYVRQILQNLLPNHHVPDRYRFVKQLPKLPNGKPDRTQVADNFINQSSGIQKTVSNADVVHSELSSHTIEHNDNQIQLATSNSHDEKIFIEPLLKLWKSTLCNSNLTPSDDFFDAGGFSLLAVKLVTRMNKDIFSRHNVSISLGDLLELRTISNIADNINNQISSTKSGIDKPINNSLVTIQRGSGNEHVFLIPPFGYSALYLKQFVYHVPDHISSYSFDMTLSFKYETIENLCEDFVEKILSVQPEGPWTIISMCLGNIIAFEMAKQLKKRTNKDSTLFLIDSSATWNGPNWKKVPYHSLIEQSPTKHYIAILKREFHRDFFKALVKEKIRIIRGKFDDGVNFYIELQKCQSQQYLQYIGVPGTANIVLFRSQLFIDSYQETERWKSLTNGEFHTIDLLNVNHKNLVSQNSRYWKKIASLIFETKSAVSALEKSDPLLATNLQPYVPSGSNNMNQIDN